MKKRRLSIGQRMRDREKRFDRYHLTLEYRMIETLMRHCGERGDNEGALSCLERIIRERDRALTILAMDRINRLCEGDFIGEGFPSVADFPCPKS